MNYQNYGDCVDLAAKELGVSRDDIEFYAWPQTFGSTSGPFGGIGGQAISSFTIEAYALGRMQYYFAKAKGLGV